MCVVAPLCSSAPRRCAAHAGRPLRASVYLWVFIRGGCSGRGVQWMGVVLHSKLVYNII